MRDSKERSGFKSLSNDQIINNHSDLGYTIWECKYAKTGMNLIMMEPEGVVGNPVLYLSLLLAIPDMRLRVGGQLLIEICAALGLAKAMGNDCIFHSGEFSWLVGRHKTSPHTNYDEDMLRDGYVNEYDIPLKLVDALPDAERVDTIEQAVSNFFKTHKFPY